MNTHTALYEKELILNADDFLTNTFVRVPKMDFLSPLMVLHWKIEKFLDRVWRVGDYYVVYKAKQKHNKEKEEYLKHQVRSYRYNFQKFNMAATCFEKTPNGKHYTRGVIPYARNRNIQRHF